MEHLLTQASTELSIRSQVEATLIALLHDVETAHTLEQTLHTHIVLHDLRERYAALLLRYEEREAVWETERREKERLGLAFLEEIVKLSAKEVMEEKERRAMEMQLQRLMAERQETTVDADHVTANPDVRQGSAFKENVRKEKIDVDEVVDAHSTASKDGGKESINIPTEKQGPIKRTTQDDNIHPHQFNEATLMAIFSFLDPLDVMNFAQINKAMFSRIDELFGIGSSAGSSEPKQGSVNISTDANVSIVSNVDASAIRPPLPPTSVASTSVVAQSSASVASANSMQSTGAAPKTSPKLFAMPSPSIPSIVVGPASGSSWLSRFGATADSTPTASTTQTTHPPTHGRTPSSSSIGSTTPSADHEIKLNAAMANSMASKLTPAELSIILRMREKLQKCEADAARWRQENEDAVAKLASVEAVKEFLVTRVRDTEKMVETQRDEMKEVQRKNLADQEVIVYLDEKVNKLEKEVSDMKSKEAITKQEAADIVAKNEKKVRVLSDMLRFEREQVSSNEQEWKNTKRVLVKEVKSCRARIVLLEAELEGMRKQNEQLKEGLKVLSPGMKGLKLR